MEDNKELVTAKQQGKMRIVCIRFADDTRAYAKQPMYTYRSGENFFVNEVIKISSNKQAIIVKIIDTDATVLNTMTGEFKDKVTGIHDVELKELVLFKAQEHKVQYFERM